MSLQKRLTKAIRILRKKLYQQPRDERSKKSFWLFRTFLVSRRKTNSANAGFVLPTVVMVGLVVVLLTTAILFRSFERSKNASNVRVNEITLKAAAPALDRARAKIEKLFEDPQLPRATPTDKALYDTFVGPDDDLKSTKIDDYTFKDEVLLELTSGTQKLRSAWMYPVDTDNNGKFDSYVLYGVYFKNPEVINGKYTRARNSLEARTPPMISGTVSAGCEDILGTSATLVGGTGWFNINGKLKKSLFVYTATVPISDINNIPSEYSTKKDKFEKYQGNKSFSALEYQQDRIQLPLVNNAVLYEDDIELTPGPSFNLNGRIFTNSNFLVGGTTGIKLHQVSSPASCFYEDDNGKIFIGGNLANGKFIDTGNNSGNVKFDLYPGSGKAPFKSSDIETSVTDKPAEVAYNSQAYVQRINRLVDAQIKFDGTGTKDPQIVKDAINKEKKRLGLASFTPEEELEIRKEQLEIYFRKRTRRVTYKEVNFGSNALTVAGSDYSAADPITRINGELLPPDAWIYPTDPTDGKSGGSYAKLTLQADGNKLKPGATEPVKLSKLGGEEKFLGDRVLIGNNLPEFWWDKQKSKFVGPHRLDEQEIKSTIWNDGEGTRKRRTRVETLVDLGNTERDKDWEEAAAKAKTDANKDEPVGGLRVITGAGIYLPEKLTLSSTQADFNLALSQTDKIWSDMMPIPSLTAFQAKTPDTKETTIIFDLDAKKAEKTPYLRMRSSAVYHYASTGYTDKDPKPIACVSSYYNPTNSKTAKNQQGLPDIGKREVLKLPENRVLSLTDKVSAADAGNSNNGVVYSPLSKNYGDYKDILKYQIKLKYPNGRLVNELLKEAIEKLDTSKPLTISEKSSLDAAICSLQILDGSISQSTVIPHGAIKEISFLDARQIKAIHQDNTTVTPNILETFTNADEGAIVDPKKYDLPLRDRQPLEIRATVLDIDLLRRQSIGTGEYLLPNSGIIYATREDALKDLSALIKNGNKEGQKRESPVDFVLDPTRRPNAIALIYGDKIWRNKDYKEAEKGLILASNIPVYIQGSFNRHSSEEFTATLDATWSNFYTRTSAQRNTNFACRPKDPRLPNCTIGDEWRPASVLADSVTLLSNNFRFGFRNEGDYDLNNNLGDKNSVDKFLENGFFPNAFVANYEWYGADGYPKDLEPSIGIKGENNVEQSFQSSSYLNNFVTPIQRRSKFHEYVMEVCQKLPVSVCEASDWKVDIDGSLSNTIPTGTDVSKLKTGTTAQKADDKYQRYPRRVAFKRNNSGELIFGSDKKPIILGIESTGKVAEYSLEHTTNSPRLKENALWFKTTDGDNKPNNKLRIEGTIPPSPTKYQPRLQPLLQIETPFGKTDDAKSNIKMGDNSKSDGNPKWLQIATETTFNLAIAAGDTPARPQEDNGGLHNFVRFLEHWNPTGNTTQAIKAKITGSFIQLKRSVYATAPFSSSTTDDTTQYQSFSANDGRASYYIAPFRQWGFDVGLLSQSPDLFAQKLVRMPDDLPDEFFREVGRDDKWVKTLLCADRISGGKAIDTNQVPSNCQ
jgi:hypothetical protein